ncbi:MAG TPA: EamA family transporter [Granulicella sp.]
MPLKRILAYAAIYLLWGGSYLAIHFIVQTVPPVFAASIRYGVSGLLLLLLSYLAGHRTRPTPRQVFNSFLTGAGMFALGYAGVYWAETRLPSWLVSVLTSTALFWTYAIECLVLRAYRLRWIVLMPILLGLVCMPLLVGATLRNGRSYSLLAVFIVLFGAISWAVFAAVMKRVEMPSSYLQTASLQMLISGLLLFVISCSLHEWYAVPSITHIGSKALLGFAYLVFGSSLIGFTAFHWLMVHDQTLLIATYTYINPIVATLLGILLGHELYSPQQMLATFVLLLSIGCVWNEVGRNPSRLRSPVGSAAGSEYRIPR